MPRKPAIIARVSFEPPHLWGKVSVSRLTYRNVSSGLLLRIGDFAVVDDNGVARAALTVGPADRLRELRVRVAKEELVDRRWLVPALYMGVLNGAGISLLFRMLYRVSETQVSPSARTERPGKEGVTVQANRLHSWKVVLTISSFLTLFAFCQPLMTYASLDASTATTSTPLALIWSSFSM